MRDRRLQAGFPFPISVTGVSREESVSDLLRSALSAGPMDESRVIAQNPVEE